MILPKRSFGFARRLGVHGPCRNSFEPSHRSGQSTPRLAPVGAGPGLAKPAKSPRRGNMPTCHQRNKRLFQWPPWHTLATKLLNQSGGQCTMITRSQKLRFCQGRIPYAFPAWLAYIYFYICKFGMGNAKGR